LVDVIVRNGVADVRGSISDVAQRNALRVLVASTPGVTQVEDRLTWQGEEASVT
jgi:osmotically-inducible protein OsmY